MLVLKLLPLKINCKQIMSFQNLDSFSKEVNFFVCCPNDTLWFKCNKTLIIKVSKLQGR